MAAENRRAFIRVRSRLLAFCKDLRSGKVQRTLTQDVGAGGLRLLVEEEWQEPWSPGVRLEVEFRLADRAQPIMCQAEVVWITPRASAAAGTPHHTCEVGVTFTQIQPKDHATLIQYAKINAVPDDAGGR